MNEVEEQALSCPYCGEMLTVLIDCSQPVQRYVEDCQVCCQPIELTVSVDPDTGVDVSARREDD